ncbi:MAG: N-acetylmuramoyl-L-alanine amidase [Polyangiaceae bacterium]|nr:N-acetylmuramoyl-L-alanine amidase [Polyangiaceae bacterium]
MVSRRQLALGLAAAAGLTALAGGLWRRHGAHDRPPRPAHDPPRHAAKSGWPEPGARLTPPEIVLPAGLAARRIYLDAGHGAAGNAGNTSCFCVEEQRFTVEAARALADRLEATGAFEVRLSREGEDRVEYRDRIDDAQAWGADAFISLHSDVRGRFERWEPRPAGTPPALPGGAPVAAGMTCPMSLSAPGFSVLWSDEAASPLREERLALARAVANRMAESGLLPYGGAEYTGLYDPDPVQPGVFVDRHTPDQRIFVLRRPPMPSVLIETHHALDPREAERWTEPRTLDAFAAAVGAALLDALGADQGRGMRTSR